MTGSPRVITLRQGGSFIPIIPLIVGGIAITAGFILSILFLVQDVSQGKGIKFFHFLNVVGNLGFLTYFLRTCGARREITIDVGRGSVRGASRYLDHLIWHGQMRTAAEYSLSCFREVRVIRDRSWRSRLFPIPWYLVQMIGPEIELDLIDPNLWLSMDGTYISPNRLSALTRFAAEIAESCGLSYADTTAPNNRGIPTSG